jgi:hypothetical protein
LNRIASACAALWLTACLPSIEPILSCEARGNARPLCGFQNPEDLVVLPALHALIVSEYGNMAERGPGQLSRLDLATEERTVLFRAGGAASAEDGWGDPACPGPPEQFSPHGIDLIERKADARLALLVVNHGEREAVEFFEVLDADGPARVEWRGCAIPPEGSWLNEVAALPSGGFFVSHMMPRRGAVGQAFEFAKAGLLGLASGHVIEWSPKAGFSIVPGSETVFPNGVEVSADGNALYINSTLGGSVRGIDLETGRLLGEVEIESPDNLAWTADGHLLVASLTAPTLELQACGALEAGACPGSFEIWSLDPDGFAAEIVYESDGVTMGAGTVGLLVGGELFVGSFAGDRILRVQLEPGRG